MLWRLATPFPYPRGFVRGIPNLTELSFVIIRLFEDARGWFHAVPQPGDLAACRSDVTDPSRCRNVAGAPATRYRSELLGGEQDRGLGGGDALAGADLVEGAAEFGQGGGVEVDDQVDRKSTRLNSSP